ncbi:MAG: DUF2461 domain-containing protein [Pseudomonadota bacterium]
MLAPPFFGFGPSAIRFFEGLAANNTKVYFEAHRETFEDDVKRPLDRLLGEAAETFGGTVKIFRQNRDIRFSKDKSPYKTSTYGLVRGLPRGRVYYAAIGADGFHAATGLYEMAKDQLERFRRAVDSAHGDGLAEALAAAEAAGLVPWGDALKSAPRGYAKDHPRIDLLRRKALVLSGRIGTSETLEGRRPLEHAYETWRAAAPVLDWLEAHVGPSELPDSGRR